MNTDGVRQTDPLAAQQLALAVCLLERLHIGGDWWLPQGLGEFAAVPRLPNHRAIEVLNAATNLRELLLEFGYTDAGSGRMHRPGGNTAGVQLHSDNTASIYSSADPLWCGHRITPAHALCVFAYDGDVGAMAAEASGSMTGIS